MAIKGSNTLLQVGTAAGSPKTITGITAASPPVVTSTSHGLADGTIVIITGVVGMTQVNNRSFIVDNTATNTFELKGVDGTSYTTYGSGGTATSQTMTAVGAIKSVTGFNGEASEIDTTDLQSTAKTFLLGLQDFGTVDLGLFLVTDTGQAKLRSLKGAGSTGTFAIILSDARVATFQGLVKSFAFDAITPESVVSGTCSLRVTYEPSFFA